MGCAVGLALDHRLAAEPELLRARFAFGPGALAGSEVLEAQDLGGFGLPGNRRVALRQPQAMDLADDGVLGDAKPVADLAGGESLIPESDQGADLERCPFFRHVRCFGRAGRESSQTLSFAASFASAG